MHILNSHPRVNIHSTSHLLPRKHSRCDSLRAEGKNGGKDRPKKNESEKLASWIKLKIPRLFSRRIYMYTRVAADKADRKSQARELSPSFDFLNRITPLLLGNLKRPRRSAAFIDWRASL